MANIAGITVTQSGTTYTYTITDSLGNTATVTAIPNQVGISTSGNGLIVDGQTQLDRLLQMLQTGLRPLIFAGALSAPYDYA